MVQTEIAAKAIEERHAKAKELEKLTEEQLLAVKTALRTQTWRKTLLDCVLGFVLGIGSSFAASVLYARWRRRRTMS